MMIQEGGRGAPNIKVTLHFEKYGIYITEISGKEGG